MSKIQQLLESATSGQILTIQAGDLGLSDAQFHAMVDKWHAEGGEGFSVRKLHRESQTGNSWIDLVVIQKD